LVLVEARGGIEPRAFPPDACRFGLEDRCRERGPIWSAPTCRRFWLFEPRAFL